MSHLGLQELSIFHAQIQVGDFSQNDLDFPGTYIFNHLHTYF